MSRHHALALGLLAVLLTGCQAGTGDGESTTQTEQGNPDRKDSESRQREWFARLGTCLTDAGFPAELNGDVLTVAGTQDRPADYKAVRAACEEQLGEIPGSDPLTEEELGVLYDLYLDAADCLRQHGLPVTAQMPSRDTWVAQEMKAMTSSSVEPPPLPYDGLLAHQYQDVCPWPTGEDIYNRMNQGDG